MRAPKLCVIVREDLSPGYKVAQAVHGGHAFADAHPADYRVWRGKSNTVTILGARDEAHLDEMRDKAEMYNIPYATFREPDLGDATTVLVLGPHPATRKITGRLPLLS
jgi:peptidyl-tRNA hydrolase